jgi:DNA invertase Pin-like site-specific DNA recombinase/predicted metal-binding protein
MPETQPSKLKYFLYRRKSTDESDRQILSLESQEAEAMKRFSDLDIVQLPAESVSAFEPYKRPVFADMVLRIQKGEAQGIIAWHPDRLSRNPMDAAQILYLIDTGAIKDLKFCSYYFDNSPEGKMMLGMTLSQSKYSSDKLSKDVKRGINRKAEMGWRPGLAPLGYRNTKTGERGSQKIIKDPERFDLVKEMFKLMLTGNYTVPHLHEHITKKLGLRMPPTRKKMLEREIHLSSMYRILTDTFYYGAYEWVQGSGNWYKGLHEAIITEDEFDRIQYLLGRKGKPRNTHHKFSFTGMIRCGNCNGMITAEEKYKHLRNGKILHFIYYHCTKRPRRDCPERSIELKKLTSQIDDILSKITIPEKFQAWAIEHLHEIRKTEVVTREQSLAGKQRLLTKVTQDLDSLVLRFTASSNTDESVLTTAEFQALKGRLTKEKLRVEEDLKNYGAELEEWIELSEKTFNFARYARTWFAQGDLETKRAIFACLGSNPLLKDRQLIINLQKPFELIFEKRNLCEEELKRLEPLVTTVTKGDIEETRKEFPVMSR